ncbi:hypothetical protein [Actinoplanes derwentensis]|uniref:DUF4064 domain-containing protein n=1 Tax=Actinoplanes derwentensis TaxID=113562 RepID=A0A1H1R4L2_9ACTN|nr:hypothetical protein [Actinoplanes derwentensis]GID88014.1 hypothetical protein Ade03nite_69380 [Actinoplanes derwentensis]SDS30697.1 hypothetical protein SAMN04489716_0494 [Actinoplanes derwentensis]
MRKRWFVAALLLSLGTALALLFLPTVAVNEAYGPAGSGQSGQVVVTDRMASLWDSRPEVAFALAVPVLACALPLLVRPRHRRAAAGLSITALTVFVLLGLLSVGLFFLPGVILMAIGAVRFRPRDS